MVRALEWSREGVGTEEMGIIRYSASPSDRGVCEQSRNAVRRG